MIKGHLTICKVYNDGTSEVVLDKANMITKGLGSSFIDIQEGKGGAYVENFVPQYFQLGTSSVDTAQFVANTSAYFYHLSTPFGWSEYGEDTDFSVEKKYRGFYASSQDAGVTYTEMYGTSASLSALVFSGSDEYFARLKVGSVTKFFLDSCESEIILDERTGNGQSITEIGLYMRNPKGFKGDSPVLMAYKSFTAIPKSSEYSLVFHWNIGFLGTNTQRDAYYVGGEGKYSGPSIVGKSNTKLISGPLEKRTK